MKKVLKLALLLSVIAASLLSCSHLFEDDEDVSISRNGGGGANRTTVDGRAVSDDADTLEKALKEAGFTIDDSGEIQGANVPEYFFIVKPDGTSEKIEISSGTLSSADLEKPIPLGTHITSIRQPPDGKKLIEYKVQDLNGNTHTIPVEVPNSVAKAKWSDIIKSAKDKGITIGNTPSGCTGNWKAGTSELENDTEVDPTQTIKPEFTKPLKYSVDKDGNGVVPTDIYVPYQQTGATLKQIMGGTNVSDLGKKDGNNFTGWKVTLPDGTVKTVTSAQINSNQGDADGIFPAGTKIEPTWYGDGGAAGGTPLTNLSSPAVGDGVTKDGEIIPKGTITRDNSGKILGYVYSVNAATKTVSVVAKEVIQSGTADNPQPSRKWSGGGSGVATYDGFTSSYNANSDPSHFLHTALKDMTDGYDAWLRVYGWHNGAQFSNYPAIKTALVYPIAYDSSDVNTNDKVNAIVNGNSFENRWYLPTVKELEDIYNAREQLLNWTKDSHDGIGTTWLYNKTFWSVNVKDDYDSSYSEAKFHYARSVVFSENGTTMKEEDKLTTNYVIPVRQFKYQ